MAAQCFARVAELEKWIAQIAQNASSSISQCVALVRVFPGSSRPNFLSLTSLTHSLILTHSHVLDTCTACTASVDGESDQLTLVNETGPAVNNRS